MVIRKVDASQSNPSPVDWTEPSMEIYPRMVFVLYDLPPGELRDATAFLTLSAIWKQIQDTDVVPIARKKQLS
jgi:hypothetical protein